jgi:hypothetical protein
VIVLELCVLSLHVFFLVDFLLTRGYIRHQFRIIHSLLPIFIRLSSFGRLQCLRISNINQHTVIFPVSFQSIFFDFHFLYQFLILHFLFMNFLVCVLFVFLFRYVKKLFVIFQFLLKQLFLILSPCSNVRYFMVDFYFHLNFYILSSIWLIQQLRSLDRCCFLIFLKSLCMFLTFCLISHYFMCFRKTICSCFSSLAVILLN